MSTCSDCGSTGRVLLLTVTDRAGTRRVGTCCYDANREVEPSAAQVFPAAGRGAAQPARGTQAPTAQRNLKIGGPSR